MAGLSANHPREHRISSQLLLSLLGARGVAELLLLFGGELLFLRGGHAGRPFFLAGLHGSGHRREPVVVQAGEFGQLVGHRLGEIRRFGCVLAQVEQLDLRTLGHELPIAGTHRPPAFAAAGAPAEVASGRGGLAAQDGQQVEAIERLVRRRRYAVRVPELRMWGLVAIECDGPAAEELPADGKPLDAAPKIPDVTAPIQAAKASEWEFAKLGVRALAGGDRQRIVADELASKGRAVELKHSLAVRVQRNPGLNWGWVQPIPTGRYRVAVRCRAPQPSAGKLTLTCSTANEAHEQNKFPRFPQFRVLHDWNLADVPADRYGVLVAEMRWDEMPHEAELRFESDAPGLLLEGVLVECLQILDTERIKVWKDGWPAGATLAAHSGTNVWYAQGLYHDFYRLDAVLKGLPGPVTVDRAVHFKVGQHPTGFQDAAFPSAEKLARYDLIVIADVDLITFRVPERDRLRGWVEAGGRLLMLGGPYAFGSGDWHLSDLLAPLYPAEISGRYDLRPVGVEQAVKLEPVGALAQKLNWSASPVVL